MKKYLLFTFLVFQFASSQVKQVIGNLLDANYYSKEISLFKGKAFVMKEVFGESKSIIKFELDPLSSASSGELTTLAYNCEDLKKEGIVFGFYGDYWNDAGVLYQGYSFKNLEKEKAMEFLNKIVTSIEENKKFLNESGDNNNIFFKYDDMDVLIWTNAGTYSIRIFWQGFDSTWEKTAFERSKRRFEKKIK